MTLLQATGWGVAWGTPRSRSPGLGLARPRPRRPGDRGFIARRTSIALYPGFSNLDGICEVPGRAPRHDAFGDGRGHDEFGECLQVGGEPHASG